MTLETPEQLKRRLQEEEETRKRKRIEEAEAEVLRRSSDDLINTMTIAASTYDYSVPTYESSSSYDSGCSYDSGSTSSGCDF